MNDERYVFRVTVDSYESISEGTDKNMFYVIEDATVSVQSLYHADRPSFQYEHADVCVPVGAFVEESTGIKVTYVGYLILLHLRQPTLRHERYVIIHEEAIRHFNFPEPILEWAANIAEVEEDIVQSVYARSQHYILDLQRGAYSSEPEPEAGAVKEPNMALACNRKEWNSNDNEIKFTYMYHDVY